MAGERQRGSSDASGAATAPSSDGPSEARLATAEDGASTERRSRRGAVAVAAVATAAAGATAVAANRIVKGRAVRAEAPGEPGQGDEGGAGGPEAEPSFVSRAARKASKTSEPLVQALVETGWDAVKSSVAPALERAAGAAGRFAATDAPDFVRETLLPPFVEAYQEARAEERTTAS